MAFEIVLAPEAVDDLRRLSARDRAKLRDALEVHLRHEPTKVSKSRIKRLRGLIRPQYRLRVDDLRVFYDVTDIDVQVWRSLRRKTLNYGSRRRVNPMKKVPLSVIKDDLSKYLRLAGSEEIVITRHGKPAGILVGFETEDDWFDYRLENDPAFLRRIDRARQNLQTGKGIRLEDIREDT